MSWNRPSSKFKRTPDYGLERYTPYRVIIAKVLIGFFSIRPVSFIPRFGLSCFLMNLKKLENRSPFNSFEKSDNREENAAQAGALRQALGSFERNDRRRNSIYSRTVWHDVITRSAAVFSGFKGQWIKKTSWPVTITAVITTIRVRRVGGLRTREILLERRPSRWPQFRSLNGTFYTFCTVRGRRKKKKKNTIIVCRGNRWMEIVYAR